MTIDSNPGGNADSRVLPNSINIAEFMRMLAHELGNPVASIRMSSEMMLGELPNDIREQLSQIVFDEAIRLETLIEGAVYYATLQQGTPLHLEIEPLLQAAYQQIDSSASLASRLEPSAPRMINGDAAQLTRLFREILANAVQAGASEIKLDVVSRGDESIFTVVDNGEGIPGDKLSVVSTPFYSSRDGQLGLGLPIARKIAEQHGGTIDIAPSASGGTAVTLALPSARPHDH